MWYLFIYLFYLFIYLFIIYILIIYNIEKLMLSFLHLPIISLGWILKNKIIRS